MATNDNACPASRSPSAGWLALGLAATTVLLVLSLASSQFQTILNSDLLWPQVFLHDLHDPIHPVSGWNFGSAAFWVPDLALCQFLVWLCGNSGLSYPLYAVVTILLMGLTMGWSLTAAGINRAKAFVAAFFGLNLVLLGQGLLGHSYWLWHLGLPGYHGGSVVTGFAVMALVLGAAQTGQWSWGRSTAVVLLMFLGVASDVLLFVHWLVPLGVALAVVSWRAQSLRPVAMGYATRVVLAVAMVLLLRLALAQAEIFSFFTMVRFAPTPALMWSCLTRFLRHLGPDGLFADYWLLWLLGAGGLAAAVEGLRRVRERDPIKRVAMLTGLLSLLLALAAPIAMNYWADFHSIRYLPNWLTLPAWLLALRVCSHPAPARWLPHLAVAGGLAGLVFAVPNIEADKLVFPRPATAQMLREFCQRHNFREGLSSYWNGHLLTVEWNFSGPRLGEIEDDYFPSLWCNNTYDYFPPAENGRTLARPAPQFIILNGLDYTHVLHFLGTNILRVTHVGPYFVAVLTPEQTKRAGDLITKQALDALPGRRAAWLQSQLPPATE
jgi:hypothetical protein